jgi:phosphate transport system permease protein
MSNLPTSQKTSREPKNFVSNLPRRHRAGAAWRTIFFASTVFGIIALAVLLWDVVNDSFGYTAFTYKVNPASLTSNGKPLIEGLR